MRPSRSGGRPDRRILDLIEPPEYTTSLVATPFFNRKGDLFFGAGTLPILENASGWAVTLNRSLGGMLWATAQSAAATRKTRYTTRLVFPVSANISNGPSASFLYWRYQIEGVVYRQTPLVADAALSFGFCSSGGTTQVLSDSTLPGYELVSISTLNGGRWTPRWRLANAGALVTGSDSGVDPANFPGGVHLAIRLDHTPTAPRLLGLINGVEVGVLSGFVNMPVPTSSLIAVGLCQGYSAGGGVGQNDYNRQCRFYIEELGA